jgi:IclR family transcriptional regulator, blcABC operon repressor
VLRNQLVQIALLDGAQVLYLAVFEGRQRLPMSASVGDRYPASVTAVGTALLSELTPGQVAELYWDTGNLVGFTKKSTSTLAELQGEKLERTRERGYAVDEGEVHPTVFGLAIPIPGGSGEPSFAIGVSILHPTGSVHERETILSALRSAADSLTRPGCSLPEGGRHFRRPPSWFPSFTGVEGVDSAGMPRRQTAALFPEPGALGRTDNLVAIGKP